MLRRIQGERLDLMPYEYLSLGVLQAETGHRKLFDTLFVLRNNDAEERLEQLRTQHGVDRRRQRRRDALPGQPRHHARPARSPSR